LEALYCNSTDMIILEDLIISLLNNELLSETEVRETMIGRGPVVSIRPTGPLAGEHVSTAWIVEFRYYADCREAIRVRFSCKDQF
jgi:hypothetical protein